MLPSIEQRLALEISAKPAQVAAAVSLLCLVISLAFAVIV